MTSLSTYPSIYHLSVYLPIHPSIHHHHLSVCLSICLPTHPPTHPSTNLSPHPSIIYLSTHLSNHQPTHISINHLSVCLSTHPLSIHPSSIICLTVYLPVCLSVEAESHSAVQVLNPLASASHHTQLSSLILTFLDASAVGGKSPSLEPLCVPRSLLSSQLSLFPCDLVPSTHPPTQDCQFCHLKSG